MGHPIVDLSQTSKRIMTVVSPSLIEEEPPEADMADIEWQFSKNKEQQNKKKIESGNNNKKIEFRSYISKRSWHKLSI
jgi:hypothetical protein